MLMQNSRCTCHRKTRAGELEVELRETRNARVLEEAQGAAQSLGEQVAEAFPIPYRV
jgi:hypothetical protein